MEQNFGATSARAIDYYADTNLASTSPAEYRRALRQVFGAGTGHLLSVVVSGLGRDFGIEVQEGTSLEELIETLRPRAGAK